MIGSIFQIQAIFKGRLSQGYTLSYVKNISQQTLEMF